MMGMEIVYLLAVASAIGLLLFGVRRASQRSQQLGGAGRVKRLPGTDADEEREEERDHDVERAPDDKGTGEQTSDEIAGDHEDEEAAHEAQVALQRGLAKTRSGFVSRLGRLLSKKTIDAELLGEVEEILLTADIGPRTAERLFTSIKGALSRDELEDPEAVWTRLRQEASDILAVDAAPIPWASKQPFVLLVLGVNGVGKTTTIGKVAAKLVASGKKVMLAAGDTFRAAAAEQLEIWAERAGAGVVRGKAGGDPSSVIFDAIKRAQAEDYDIVIADTAGRLHTKVELMEELRKVGRVIDKAAPGAPHETWLVLDSTTGQNAIQQAKLFKESMKVTGIVLTKLDGTAKGGVILGICDEMAVPVRYIGIGEGVDDLREFEPEAFVDALFQAEQTANAA